VEEGIIPGGGVALVKATRILDEKIENLEAEEKAAYQIVRKAIVAPMYVMAANAGIEDPARLIENAREDEGNLGYDFTEVFKRKAEMVDMFSAGIIDPLKVARLALENAASIAGTVLNTEAVLVDLPEEKKESASGGPGMEY